MPKKEYNKIKSMTKVQLYEFYKDSEHMRGEKPEDFYIGVYNYGKELYEFGKYVDFEPPKKSMKHFFKKQELKERYEEYDFYVVTPEFLEYIIESYTKKIQKYYKEMVMPFLGEEEYKSSEFLKSVQTKYGVESNNYKFDFSKITDAEQTALYKMIEHIRSFSSEWNYLLPYNLKQGEEVSISWKYEYGLFELVRIYKTFDWKKNVMIYYGY
jgi:hypothetical protein